MPSATPSSQPVPPSPPPPPPPPDALTENVNEEEHLRDMGRVRQELFDRIKDWRNCDIEQIGALLLADEFLMWLASREEDQEFHIYLFERTLVSCKDRNSGWGPSTYQLKGHIQLRDIYLVEDISRIDENAFALRITWSVGEDSVSFVMNGRSVHQIQLWNDRLGRQAGAWGESPRILALSQNAQSQEQHQQDHSLPVGAAATAAADAAFAETVQAQPPSFVKIKTHYHGEVFMIAMPTRGATLADLVARLERKIRLCGGTPPQAQGHAMRILYRAGRGGGGGVDGPDGGEAAEAATAGLATIESDSDVTRAFAEAAELGETTLSVFVS
ncbi:hypothetical protein HK405_009106 [Cladochytrium tenue]|nr:hypothetical protein HK405_009106 [Cladochytrium tenue]